MEHDIEKRALIKLIDGLRSELALYRRKAIGSELLVKTFQKKIETLRSEISLFKNKKRRSQRVVVGIGAEMFAGNKRYVGFIKSLSEHGMYLITTPTISITDFVPGTTADLQFRLTSGDMLRLRCKIVWLHTIKPTPRKFFNTIGLEITKQFQSYKEFYKSLL